MKGLERRLDALEARLGRQPHPVWSAFIDKWADDPDLDTSELHAAAEAANARLYLVIVETPAEMRGETELKHEFFCGDACWQVDAGRVVPA